jgi:hypothetical protein
MAIGEYQQPFQREPQPPSTPSSAENDHKLPSQALILRHSLVPAVIEHAPEQDGKEVTSVPIEAMKTSYHPAFYNNKNFFTDSGQLMETFQLSLELVVGATQLTGIASHMTATATQKAFRRPAQCLVTIHSEIKERGLLGFMGSILLGNTFENAKDL